MSFQDLPDALFEAVVDMVGQADHRSLRPLCRRFRAAADARTRRAHITADRPAQELRLGWVASKWPRLEELTVTGGSLQIDAGPARALHFIVSRALPQPQPP